MKAFCTAFFLVLMLAGASWAQEEKTPTPVELVKKLYTDHLADKGLLVGDAEKTNWPTAFGKDLVKALTTGNWGFDPLIFAQDHELKNLAFKEIDRDDTGNVFVLVSFKNFDQFVRLVVSIKKAGKGYLIENIVEPATGIDLLHDLSDGEE